MTGILVDPVDQKLLDDHNWFVRSDGYVMTSIGGNTMYLHRLITAAARGIEVDHRNRNPLDNRRANLRLASTRQNHANRPSLRGRPKGVCFEQGRWSARIRINGRQKFLGSFDRIEDAGAAYATKALELYGEFAYAGDL